MANLLITLYELPRAEARGIATENKSNLNVAEKTFAYGIAMPTVIMLKVVGGVGRGVYGLLKESGRGVNNAYKAAKDEKEQFEDLF